LFLGAADRDQGGAGKKKTEVFPKDQGGKKGKRHSAMRVDPSLVGGKLRTERTL